MSRIPLTTAHARYDRAEESSDIQRHVLLLGCAASGLALVAALAFAEVRVRVRARARARVRVRVRVS